MENKKKGQLKTNIVLLILLTISLIIVGAVADSDNTFVIRFNDSLNISIGAILTSTETVSQEATVKNNFEIGKLAKVFNEDNLDFDRSYKVKYLSDRQNFNNLNFKEVITREDATLITTEVYG